MANIAEALEQGYEVVRGSNDSAPGGLLVRINARVAKRLLLQREERSDARGVTDRNRSRVGGGSTPNWVSV